MVGYDVRRWIGSWRRSLPVLILLALFLIPLPLSAAPCTYIVQRGDTLSRIAARNGITVSAIMAANPTLRNPNQIRVGQRLQLPNCAPGTGSAPAPSQPQTPPPAAPQPPAQPTELKPVPPHPSELDQALWQRVHDATIMVRHPANNPIFGGSGIVVGNDGRTFITAYHVVRNPFTNIESTRVAVGPFADWRFTAEVIAADPKLDLAILRVREADFPGFAVAPIGSSATLNSNSPIYTLSYPGFEGALVSGKGHYLRTVSSPYNSVPLIMTDATATFGSSGGTAVNDKGELIGIITAGVMGREAVRSLGYTGINQATLLVPIDAAANLLRQAGVR